jgi:hypothetical protein
VHYRSDSSKLPAMPDAQGQQTEAEFVEEALAMFAANPLNRDIAMARCLYYLTRLEAVGRLVESVMPQVSGMAGNGLIGRMLGAGRP